MSASVSAPPTVLEAPRPAPQVRLLGSPALLHDSKTIPLEADRAHGLLALLGCRRDWVRRDELADLLYPGRDLESARSNLRKVVFLARKVEGVGEIEQRGDLLRWAPDSDLERFEAACDARRYGEAVALYGGTLLLGLDPAWPKAAREWLDAERQRLQSRWHDACTRRLGELADEPEALRALAETMLRHDPLDDVALQALARAQQALGRADEALAAVADYARRLTDELKIEPPAALRQLADDLRSASPAPAAPAPATALIGRRHERGQVRERLADPSVRLLTLLGPPGVGKSALARSIAAEHGGAWVALEPVTGIDDVPAALAAALGLVPDGRLAPWEGLAQTIGPRVALLVLDNVETLPLAGPLAALLVACPGLRVVATSRAPVGVEGEWRMPLDGLPLPDLDERDPEVLRANDAVALFERRARPLVPSFDLAAEAGDVVQLVHDVDGLPLAIELLAAWRRVMPVRAIVEELAASLEVLEPSAPGERSVRAAFERSWRLLGAAEQRALARLACLPSPGDREMARSVVQAPLPVLATLVDRSLLRADDAGRFWLHPLIRRCAQALADDVDALRERHARHAAATLSRPGAALDDMLAHALAAWDWGVAHTSVDVLGPLAQPLSKHLELRGRWAEGLASADAALAVLRPLQTAQVAADSARAEARRLAHTLARVLLMRAGLTLVSGRLDETLAETTEAQALAAAWDLPGVARSALSFEGGVHWQRGMYEAAEAAFRQFLALTRAEGGAEHEALSKLGLVAKAQGRFDEALNSYSTVLQALRERQSDFAGFLYVFNNMGNLLRTLGRYDDALALLQEALDLARKQGSVADEPFLLVNIARVHEDANRLDEAARLAAQARDVALQYGEPIIEAAARLSWARIMARRTGDRRGLGEVRTALAIGQRLGSTSAMVDTVATAGVVLAATGDPRAGVALLRWAMTQAAFTRSQRVDAERQLDLLGLRAAPHDALPAELTAEELVARLPLA
jgi:predicted ATPase/DNA-binding SARP family transcriptional activator